MNIVKYIDRINDLYGNESTPKRFDTTQWLRPGFRGGQLVDHGPSGVRQGYQGESWRIKQQAKNIKVQKETWNKIAEAMLKADTTGNFEYMMSNIETQKKVHEGKVRYEKGMLSKNMQNVIYGGKRGEKYLYPLAQNDTALKYIANKLKEADPANFGGDVDRVLDILEESKDFSQESTRLTWQEKKLAESSKMRDQFAKGEKWMMDNGHRFDDPAKFEAAYIKRFGRNNAFIKAINNKTHHYFSPDFNVDIVGAKTFVGEGSKLNKKLGKNIFSAVIYHMNEDVKNSITAEFKKALSGDVPTVKYQARKTLSQSPLLKKFGLDKEIRGPISRLIIKEVGDKMYDNIQTFRKPRIGTWGLLNYLEDVVDPKYKGAITEAKKALDYAVKNKWPEAKKALKIADNINWDHKVSSFLIDAGYADKLEYAKLQPTTEHFNKKIKRDQFDKPMGRLIKEYENAPASKKGSVIQKMKDLKDDFSRKYGGYLDEVKITTDKTGKPIFTSKAGTLTKKTDVVKALKTSLRQEVGKFPKSGGPTLGSNLANVDADMFDFRKLPGDVRHFADIAARYGAKSPALLSALKKAKGAGKWTGLALAAEPAFAAPFAEYGYKMGESPERLWGDATFGLFGETEQEELKKAVGERGYATQQIDNYGSTLSALEEKYRTFNDQNDPRGEKRQVIENMYKHTRGKYSKAYNMFVDEQGEFDKGLYDQALNNYTAGVVQIDKFKKQKQAERIEQAGGYDNILQEREIRDIKGFAGGGLTRTVAPDSGPVSRGLRSLYIDDMD